ncbi:hypothetical protein ACE1B6_07130 [Aerosakkonemataceae cyanobacterium BLCC-F154]|uniref:Glycosyltransferase RgtA/B/C/D-like domain-containing protein n=1 Tax=Floridaenema fluviatile BLCC-F154 TaxID=3153640 RepID=A0ABV4Y897_9CYAN
MKKSKVKNILVQVLGFSLAIAPALLIATLIFKNSVNVPFWDDWGVGLFLTRVFPEFRLSLARLISQHNESRYVFPRLIFMALTHLNNGKWNVIYQMWLSLVLACLVSINVFRLIKWTIGKNLFKVICSVILCNLLIFSPVHYENWLWGIQLIVFMPIACITTCLVVIYSGIDRKTKLIAYLILCTISTFSYANGMLSWIILFPILAISKSWNLPDFFKEKWLYIPCIATFTANMAVYFYNYQKPLHSPSFIYGILHPDQALLYFLSFLGSPLMRATIRYDWKISSLVNNNIWMGTILIILFLGSLTYFVKERKDSTVIYRMTGWLTIGFYTVISGLVTSLGRSGGGLESSVALRYTAFSIYLPLALINLIWIIYDDAKIKGYLLKNSQRMVQSMILILLAGALYFHIITVDFTIPQMYFMKLERLQAKACYIFLNVAPEEKCIIEKVYPQFLGLKYRAYLVNSSGIIDAKLLKSNRIQDIQGINRGNSKELIYGWFEQLNKVDENNYLAGGWAILPKKKEPADAVILSYEQSHGEDIIFAVFDTRVNRPDVVQALKRTTYSMSGWQKTFPASRLPKGLVKIKAWAFDTETAKAYQIAGTQVVKN